MEIHETGNLTLEARLKVRELNQAKFQRHADRLTAIRRTKLLEEVP